MKTEDFIQILIKNSPNLPSSEILKNVDFIHNGEDDWEKSDDVNYNFREDVVNQLFEIFENDDREIIKYLLNAEIEYCREESTMTEMLKQLTFMLYLIGEAEDIPLLFKAKMKTSFDAETGLDIALIFGKNKEQVKKYFRKNPHKEYDIIGTLEEYEKYNYCTPKEFINGMMTYFGKAIQTPTTLLQQLKPSQYALLGELCELMDDSMLLEIAEADYGDDDDCFSVLNKIKQTRQTPNKIEFAVKEVLELIQWSTPKTEREHIMRTFACTNLIIMYCTSDINIISEGNSTFACLIESVSALGTTYQMSALQLVAWSILYEEDYEAEEWNTYILENLQIQYDTYPFYIYALLLLMILIQASSEKIDEVAEWLIKMEIFWRKEYGAENDTFLLGLTNFDLRHETWKQLTRQMLEQTDYITDNRIKEKLLKIGNCILNGKQMYN